MDEQCLRNYHYVVLSRLNKHLQFNKQFNKHFIKSYNDYSVVGYFIEADIQSPEKLHELHNDFLFLLEGMKTEKVEKLVAKLHDKKRIYYLHKKFKTSI